MLKSYVLTTLRSLFRNKTYAFITTMGLGVGIAAFILIFVVVRFENSFDNFHPDKDRIYRLVSVPYKESSSFAPTAAVPLPVAEALRFDFPSLEKVAAIFGRDGQITIEQKNTVSKKFNEEGDLFFAEPSFFEIFAFKWLSGRPGKSLAAPGTVALSKSTAQKYFGDWKQAIGKTIKYNNRDIFQVTGIFEDVPTNTDFPLNVVVSYKSLRNVDLTDWVGTYGRGYCFVKLPHGLSASSFNLQLRDFVKRHKPADHVNDGIVLQPITDMHFDPMFGNYRGKTFSKNLISTLNLIAIFLVVIACMNFVNLSTAQAINRSKEVGVRKVLGGFRSQLCVQFLGEAFIICSVSTLFGMVLASLALPAVNEITQLNIVLNWNDLKLMSTLLLLLLGVTLLSGFYPAWVLSAFNPINAIRNKHEIKSVSGKNIRKGLVVFQFAIAQTLLIAVVAVMSQMRYFHHAPLGFDKESIVTVPIPSDSASRQKMAMVKQQLLQLHGVANVSFSAFSPLDNDIWNNNFKFNHSKEKTNFLTFFKWADADFFKTYRTELIAGEMYSPSDTLNGFVVNETLVQKLGIRNPKDILGKDINFWDQLRAPVVGVVKDFHTNSLQSPIVPIVIGAWKDAYQMIGIKLKTANGKRVLTGIEKIWNSAYPDYVYEYHFLDEKIDSYYKEEQQLSQLYQAFAIIAIVISCLGLYGLVSFLAVERTKEIGVRKIMGASVGQVLYLFSREFSILIGLAFVIAAPIGYYFMHRWLEQFSYRIEMSVWIFAISLIATLLISFLAIGHKALSAAMANPIVSLRDE